VVVASTAVAVVAVASTVAAAAVVVVASTAVAVVAMTAAVDAANGNSELTSVIIHEKGTSMRSLFCCIGYSGCGRSINERWHDVRMPPTFVLYLLGMR